MTASPTRCARAGIAVECSSAGFRKPVGELYPEPSLLAGFREAGHGVGQCAHFGALRVALLGRVERIAPVVVNAARLWLTVLALVCVPGNLDALQGMSSRLWLLCAGAALAGPFLSRLSIMYAVRYITASQSALIALLAPVVAFTLDYALLGATPSRLQVLGAAVVLLGVALPVLELARREPSR